MYINSSGLVAHVRQLANELNAQYTEGSIIMVSHGCQFEINIYPPNNLDTQVAMGIPGRFEIKSTVISYSNFMVRKKDAIDWITEHIFLYHDFQTKDALFDSAFVTTVDDAEWAHRYFAQSMVRLSISAIISGGLYKIYCVDQELKVDKIVKTYDDCPSSTEIVRIAEKLSSLISVQSPRDG